MQQSIELVSFYEAQAFFHQLINHLGTELVSRRQRGRCLKNSLVSAIIGFS